MLVVSLILEVDGVLAVREREAEEALSAGPAAGRE
jgi:hypothetical protein